MINIFKKLKTKITERLEYQTDENEKHIKNIIDTLINNNDTKINYCSITSRFFIQNENLHINVIKNGIELKLTNGNIIYTTYLTNNFSDIIGKLIDNKIKELSDNIQTEILKQETNFLEILSQKIKQ